MPRQPDGSSKCSTSRAAVSAGSSPPSSRSVAPFGAARRMQAHRRRPGSTWCAGEDRAGFRRRGSCWSVEAQARQRSRRSSFPLHAIAASCTLNHMVQWAQANFDVSFGALSDATRRGVLEQLWRGDASITALAQKFHMTLTGMKKHVGVLEQAGLVTTEKVGRVRTCRLGRRRLQEEAEWIERYRQIWSARFDELDRVVETLKRKERGDGRK